MSVRYSAAAEEAREKINIAHAICTESLRMILREIDSHGAPNCASVAAARELLAEADTAHMTVLEIGRQASVRISAPEFDQIDLTRDAAL